MRIAEIEIANIDATGRLRPINPGWVETMVAEMVAGAVLAPIEVLETGAETYRLITGAHRLAAAQQIGNGTIEAKVWPADAFVDEGEIRLKEVQENVLRFELTELDRANAITAWKQIYEDSRKTPRRGRRPKSENAADSARIFAERFSAVAARALNISERSVRVTVQIATGITEKVKERIAAHPVADNQLELLQLVAQSPDRQIRIADLLLAEPPLARSVAEAIALIDRTPAPVRLSGWQKLSDGFSRLKAAEQAAFFDAHADAIDEWLARRRAQAA